MTKMKIEPIVELTKAQKKEQLARMLKKQINTPNQQATLMPSVSPDLSQQEIPEPSPLVTMPWMGNKQPSPPKFEMSDDIPEVESVDMSIPPAAELAAHAAMADRLWMDIGGYKSLAGKLWGMLADNKKYPGDARDYFISTFLKYKLDNDDSFRKMFPTEANIFSQLESVFEESLAPAVNPNASPIPSIPGLPPRPIPGGVGGEGGQGAIS